MSFQRDYTFRADPASVDLYPCAPSFYNQQDSQDSTERLVAVFSVGKGQKVEINQELWKISNRAQEENRGRFSSATAVIWSTPMKYLST